MIGRVVSVLGETREAVALRAALKRNGRATLDHATAAAPLIDAHHPIDRDGPARSRALAAELGVPRLRLARPPWRPVAGDDWRIVADERAARAALESGWRRIFVALGRDRLAPFIEDRERFYLVRVRGGTTRPLPLALSAVAPEEGPFTVEGEMALLRDERIDAILTRNDGGPGAAPKIAAARLLGVPVVMQSRPAPERCQRSSLRAALRWALQRSHP